MISEFYNDVTECSRFEITFDFLKKFGRTSAKYQETSAHCSQVLVKPLYMSQMPMTLSLKQLDGTPYGLFLATLERGDKAGLFECMANLEGSLGRALQILKGRSASNYQLLSTLRHFAEMHGLHLPSAWIREYRRNGRNKLHAKV